LQLNNKYLPRNVYREEFAKKKAGMEASNNGTRLLAWRIENINAIANKRATLHSAGVNGIMEISYQNNDKINQKDTALVLGSWIVKFFTFWTIYFHCARSRNI